MPKSSFKASLASEVCIAKQRYSAVRNLPYNSRRFERGSSQRELRTIPCT